MQLDYLSSSHKLHDEIVVAFILVHLKKLDDVRMINVGEDIDLILEPNPVIFIKLTPKS